MPAKPKPSSVFLTPDADRFVQDKIKSGEFRSAGDVVEESLRMMRAHEDVKETARAEFDEMIRNGFEQAKRGETVDPAVVWAEIRARSVVARRLEKRR